MFKRLMAQVDRDGLELLESRPSRRHFSRQRRLSFAVPAGGLFNENTWMRCLIVPTLDDRTGHRLR